MSASEHQLGTPGNFFEQAGHAPKFDLTGHLVKLDHRDALTGLDQTEAALTVRRVTHDLYNNTSPVRR